VQGPEVVAKNVPAAHAEQIPAPVVDLKVPVLHGLQVVAPEFAW